MFVTCSIQSLKFCRSHRYVQRGLRFLQFLRLLHFSATFALLATLTTFAKFDCYLLPALATLVTLSTLSSIATRILCQDVYLKVMSRTKSNLEILFSKKQRSTYSLICSDQAPNNYRVFKFPWSSFYFLLFFSAFTSCM